MNKSIFFDVDNTLVCREENTICESTIKAIEKLKNNNVKVAIATGRSLAMVKQEEFYKMFKTIISANGSLITVKDKVIYKKYMKQESVQDIVQYFEENDIPYCLHMLDKSVGKTEYQWVKEFSMKYNMKIEKLEDVVLKNISKYEVFEINPNIKGKDISKILKKYRILKFDALVDI